MIVGMKINVIICAHVIKVEWAVKEEIAAISMIYFNKN